jgi:hypothetical protein
MWTANEAAAPTVSRSPILNVITDSAPAVETGLRVKSTKPRKASPPPAAIHGRSAVRARRAAKKGVRTTYSPVISAELDAEVVIKPWVWRAYPEKRKMPAANPSRQMAAPRGRRIKSSAAAPTRNRQPTKERGGRIVMACLTTTKVDP